MFVNTQYFREAALDYKKNGNIYCKAPPKSREFREFWELQIQRCKKGLEVGGVKITGRNYWYLNFTQIDRVPDHILKQKKQISATVEKIKDFPAFWEIDYEWWWAKHIALRGATKEQVIALNSKILAPRDYTGGQHIGCLKTRRAGFSYKESADATYNYNFIPGSKSYFFAAKDEFLTKDGVLNKVQDNLNFLNQHTQNVWYKNRMKHNTLMHQKASYIDGYKEERGYLSQIFGVIVNDPDKVRGKGGMKIAYEEGGSFRNLKKALEISLPSVKQGGYTTGQITVFGTGGEEGEDIEGLEEVFSMPSVYEMMEFPNIWEKDGVYDTCGFFVPCYMANETYMDSDGNVDIEEAIRYDDTQRALKQKSKDPKALDRRVAEFPRIPDEALSRTNNTIFPTTEAKEQIKFVLRNRDIQGQIKYGWITNSVDEGYKFKPAEDVTPLNFYPHKNDDDLTGAMAMFEKPIKNAQGQIPDNLYTIVVDPYYKDDAQDKTSLGAVYVIKRLTQLTPDGDIIVFSYVARPGALSTFHRNILLIADFYNAKVQSEIAGGGQGIIDYARMTKQLHKLEYEPELIGNKVDGKQSNQKNRSIFMNTPTEVKNLGLLYFADWLIKPRGVTEEGITIMNIHRIYDVGLLYEISKYKDGGNFDRISAMALGMFMLREMYAIEVKELQKKQSTFWDRPKFQDTDNVGSGIQVLSSDMMFNI